MITRRFGHHLSVPHVGIPSLRMALFDTLLHILREGVESIPCPIKMLLESLDKRNIRNRFIKKNIIWIDLCIHSLVSLSTSPDDFFATGDAFSAFSFTSLL